VEGEGRPSFRTYGLMMLTYASVFPNCFGQCGGVGLSTMHKVMKFVAPVEGGATVSIPRYALPSSPPCDGGGAGTVGVRVQRPSRRSRTRSAPCRLLFSDGRGGRPQSLTPWTRRSRLNRSGISGGLIP
jgi:hypothetical protein